MSSNGNSNDNDNADIVEYCPHCGEENEYSADGIGDAMLARCGGCGRWIVLCDRCGDHLKCAKCKWEGVAEGRNRREGFKAEDGE